MNDEERALRLAVDQGIELFNRGEFLEAYEVWEARWNEEPSDAADLLQGLLQVAVGFAKLEGGTPRGTVKLLAQARDKLMLYSPSAHGVDVDGFLEVIGQWHDAAQQMVDQNGVGGISLPTARVPTAKPEPT